MTQIKIVTDSSCGVTEEEIKKYNISIVPLSVMIDDTVYVEGETISNDQFIKKMATSKSLPKTSQPPLGKFVEVFDKLGEDGSQVISFNMLAAISGTVHTAEQAAKLSKSDVTVVDSQFTDRALAFQVLEAAKMALNGASKAEILARAEHIRDHTTLYLSVVNLENLVKGGRLSKISGMLGGLLNIKLLLQVKDGKLNVVNKVRGMKAMKKIWLDIYQKMQESKQIGAVGISHVEAFDMVNEMKEHVGKFFPEDKIVVRETVPIIATHTGMGAFCLLYYTED
ncbi:DegV family protein [Pediococcus stilesii]|uniref:DegV family protein n=1 Tax=Pediococcus stilesii TaxID=331679 RepID=A0A5R9BW03_9LACO|nr:DegV family protein [Pediococcus stilesii]TLQ04886.1 DegV family protein [Pediococcus stilesii]